MIWYEPKDYRKSKEEESMKGRKLKQCNLWETSEDRQSLQKQGNEEDSNITRPIFCVLRQYLINTRSRNRYMGMWGWKET